MKEEQKINLRVKDKDQFYSNEVSINFNPNEFALDFKCLTHIHDIADHRAVLLSHNVVVMHPFALKSFWVMLGKALKEYEDKFAKIDKTEAVKKAEKIMKKEKKTPVAKEELTGTYFG